MTNANRFNPRNKALGEANTLLILASLKTSPKTMAELMAVSGLTRQTVLNKIKANKEIQLSMATKPPRYYIGEYRETVTIVDEQVTPDKPKKTDSPKAAIVNSSDGIVFFPKATHHDHSKFHDHILNSEEENGFMVMYRSVGSKMDLLNLEHQLKTMYDLVQFRKTLKEYDE